MKSLILEFAETPQTETLDLPKTHYSKDLNLTVFDENDLPAISIANSATETFTKAGGEESDSDKDMLNQRILMATTTETRTVHEGSDSDANVRSLMNMMATKTITESHETTDSDK
jgi:hypothetical protein